MLYVAKNLDKKQKAGLNSDIEIKEFILKNVGKDLFPEKTAKAKEIVASLKTN
ncbi:MAG: hypothetical protein ACKVOU_12190 [Cytophagales bacterium]